MIYMLDTSICIYIIKKKPAKVLGKLKRIKNDSICISSITYSELLYGAYKSENVAKNLLALTMFLSNIDILSYDESSSIDYGMLRAKVEKRGTAIGSLDMLIAAHAVETKSILVTNNVKEFERIEHLKVEKWV